ncbi:hypothetical protein BDFB_005032 [Asbolus verrucosus]|uniref:Uncharacterized protein n=1 Tax=Asbolus verrucosus TaxID=1661398 RepID=A0A482VPB1_ASBVE|nr:hypothetical protein BDFB_005032 [Asbolus verrucosus]
MGLAKESISFEDVKFQQCMVTLNLYTDIRPLIFVKSRVIKNSYSRIEYRLKASAQFKTTSIASDVEVTTSVGGSESRSGKIGGLEN